MIFEFGSGELVLGRRGTAFIGQSLSIWMPDIGHPGQALHIRILRDQLGILMLGGRVDNAIRQRELVSMAQFSSKDRKLIIQRMLHKDRPEWLPLPVSCVASVAELTSGGPGDA